MKSRLLRYVTGDATCPIGDGAKIVVHVCNDEGGWGKGFVLAVSKRWKQPEATYRDSVKSAGKHGLELGEVQFVEVEKDVWVANLIGQHGTRTVGGRPPIRYEAVRKGLARVAEFAAQHAASVHMPRIGCGLAGGNWEEVEPIIAETLNALGVDVTVYDFSSSK